MALFVPSRSIHRRALLAAAFAALAAPAAAQGRAPLVEAAGRGDLAQVQALLRGGADIEQRDAGGRTAKRDVPGTNHPRIREPSPMPLGHGHPTLGTKVAAMKTIAILALALSSSVFAGDRAYRCVGPSGVFYRSQPCPSSSSSVAPIIDGAGGLALVPGAVQQQQIDRAEACESAREKWDRTLAAARSRGHTIQREYASRVEANIAALCY